MDNLEYIEAYFNRELTLEDKKVFEDKIISDPAFAEEVSFYLSAKKAAAAELMGEREQFKEVYAKYKEDYALRQQPGLVRKLWPWAAVAAVLAGVVFGLSIWFNPVSPTELADAYISKNLQTLSVTMSSREDSLQTGLRIYNEGRLEAALKHFETMALNDTTFIEAKKYAGIVSLRLGQYDKAINYFSQLENIRLYANPGKFYHALTLMKRNLPGDTDTAKQLLQQVVENDLEGKKDAEEWLKKW